MPREQHCPVVLVFGNVTQALIAERMLKQDPRVDPYLAIPSHCYNEERYCAHCVRYIHPMEATHNPFGCNRRACGERGGQVIISITDRDPSKYPWSNLSDPHLVGFRPAHTVRPIFALYFTSRSLRGCLQPPPKDSTGARRDGAHHANSRSEQCKGEAKAEPPSQAFTSSCQRP
jgi:hypothetical protein